ncbi:MAG: hypothetical protein JNG85_08390 [Spirochaetaceae bacterium]|nr:hypothetical protein [Spirochaetaceae bacterium]
MSAFREAPLPDGRPGPLSLRRILAAWFAVLAPVLFAMALQHAQAGWIVFLPGGVCVVASVLLCLFTTLADLKEIAVSLAKAKAGAP